MINSDGTYNVNSCNLSLFDVCQNVYEERHSISRKNPDFSGFFFHPKPKSPRGDLVLNIGNFM